VGAGRLGPFQISLPAVLDAVSGSDARAVRALEPTLREGEADSPDSRKLVLAGAQATWSVEFPIPAPEIVAGEPFGFETEDHVALVHGPPGDRLRARWRESPPAAVVLMNARALWSAGESFVEAVAAIRESAGAGPLLWLPRTALPHRLAFLSYIGADILDTTESVIQGARGAFLDPELGELHDPSAQAALRCRCAGCLSPASLVTHAQCALRTELDRVRSAALDGRLRDLVESRIVAEPRMGELLRYADRRLGPLLETATPVVSDRRTRYVLAEAQRRPEVKRFRERFLQRYHPPPSKRVLLVVPCSETKPYRRSPSHRRFTNALEGLAPLERVHLVSVTSPLGLVPRELEDIYPARHYDIPVTGDWSELERDSVSRALDHLLASGAYSSVVFHLGREEYSFLRATPPALDSAEWTVAGDRPGSPESLDRLRQAVQSALAPHAPVPGGPLTVVREELEGLAAFQFGVQPAKRLFTDPVRLAGRPWFQRLTDGHHTDLATWREERGLFHLTVAGGRRLLPDHVLEVEVDPSLTLEGDLFCPGVLHADPEIRTGDSVLLVSEGELVAVGEAELPGAWMASLPHGLAVRVRHRSPAARHPRVEATGT
jgi:archaeosine synthase